MKQVIVVRKDLGMRTGKLAGQVAHASVGAFLRWQRDNPLSLDEWTEEHHQRKVVLRADSEEILTLLLDACERTGLPHYLVRDHGLTQVEPGARTALAIGPAPEEDVDALTGALKLL